MRPPLPPSRGRIAILTSRLVRRVECRLEPVDDELLAALRESGWHLSLFVDQASEASERLRGDGCPVWTSPRRVTPGDPFGGDYARARELVRQHWLEPFALILMTADCGLPPRQLAPELGSIPVAVSVGGGPLADLNAAIDDPVWFAADWPELQAAAATLGEADLLVGDVDASLLGLELATPRRPAVDPRTVLPLAPPPFTRGVPALVALVATTSADRDLDALVGRLLDTEGPLAPRTTLAVITRAPSRRRPATGARITGGLDPALARQVIVAAQGGDGVAAELLAVADRLVLAHPRELAIPAVGAAARRCGVRLLAGALPASPTLPTRWIGAAPASTAGQPSGRIELLAWDGAAVTAAALCDLTRHRSADDHLLLHAHEAPAELFSVLAGAAPRADVVVWAGSDPLHGQATTRRVAPCALMLRQPLWTPAARVARQVDDVSELVRWAIQPAGFDRVTVLSLPAPPGLGLVPAEPPSTLPEVPLPRAGSGLPAPRFLPVTVPAPPVAAVVRTTAGGPVAPGNPPRGGRRERTALDWARQARWRDRLRLVLPWRFGLLARAMEGRW